MTMVEKVARAIHQKAYETRDEWRMPDWMEVAKAAIEAMREPTEEMKTASDQIHWGYSCHVCGGLTEGWRIMFDAARDVPKV